MFELAWLNTHQHQQISLRPGRYLVQGLPLRQGRAEVQTGREPDPEAATATIVIADPRVDTPQAWLEISPEGEIRLENLGRSVLLPTGHRINFGQSKTLAVPTQWVVGGTRFSLQAAAMAFDHDATLVEFQRAAGPQADTALGSLATAAPAASTLVEWFDALNQLQLSRAGSQAFFDHAVQCALDPGGLDMAVLIQRQEQAWQIVASQVPFPESGFAFRRDLLLRVVESGRLCYHLSHEPRAKRVQPDTQWIVAAPVFDPAGQIDAVLYAARFASAFNKRHGIRPLEAHFVRLVADAVAAATGRLAAEAQAARAQVLLEQTFSPPVVGLLQRDPQLLDSRQCEVTILFADLRGFSRLSERLGAAQTHRLLSELLDQWTTAVQGRQGVVIDYYGDGLAAFWNCPLATADHPWLACQTAWELQAILESVNQDWANRLPAPMRMGMGIHTGVAQVGNSGSRGKLKYGPRGPEVHLASRLEQATKPLGASVLLSAATADRVQDRCRLLRRCRTHLPGLSQAQDVFELLEPCPTQTDIHVTQAYTAALQAFEAGNWTSCLEALAMANLQAPQDRRIDYLLRQLEVHGQRHGWISSELPGVARTTARRENIGPEPYQIERPLDCLGID